jgi:hypothetical protein
LCCSLSATARLRNWGLVCTYDTDDKWTSVSSWNKKFLILCETDHVYIFDQKTDEGNQVGILCKIMWWHTMQNNSMDALDEVFGVQVISRWLWPPAIIWFKSLWLQFVRNAEIKSASEKSTLFWRPSRKYLACNICYSCKAASTCV